jgi:hypothetical protein
MNHHINHCDKHRLDVSLAKNKMQAKKSAEGSAKIGCKGKNGKIKDFFK